MKVTVLSGGVGGARLAHGLYSLLGADLTIVVNTADDFSLYGLAISPDLDTVLYTLTGRVHRARGWGIARDTDKVGRALRDLGDDTWFTLGDQDIALHMLRARLLADGSSLSAVTAHLAGVMGLAATLLPMTDAPVRTVIVTAAGECDFQGWFVRQRCQPRALGLRYEGIDTAEPAAGALEAVAGADLVVVGPSNPFLSVGPILAVDGYLEALADRSGPVVAVSPIIQGAAVKGPTAEMLADLQGEAAAHTVATLYSPFLTGYLVDPADLAMCQARLSPGVRVVADNIFLPNLPARRRVARRVLSLGRQLGPATADQADGPVERPHRR